MVQKRTCDYSGQEIEPGTGTMYVKNNGTVLWFADSKCEKNYLMGREAHDLEWVGDDSAIEAETDDETEDVDVAEEDDGDDEADEANDAKVESESGDDAEVEDSEEAEEADSEEADEQSEAEESEEEVEA